MNRQHSVDILNCGCNSLGLALMLSVHDVGANDEHSNSLQTYFVNCGDSTQRFCNQNKIKLSRLSLIVISSLAPHNLSGLPGVILSLSDLGTEKLTVIGPSGIKGAVENMYPFVNRRYTSLHFT